MSVHERYTSDDEQSAKYNCGLLRPTPEHVSDDRRDRIETDSGEYEFVPTFPARSPARTTFHGLRRQLWRLQHGRGHAFDDVGKTTARNDYTFRRCSSILQQCEVPKWVEAVAIQRTLTENLQGFSRHYEGADGACIGFALLAQYDDPEEAKMSYIADRAPSVVPGIRYDDVMNLIDYVFDKYGGELKC
ncbi:MAG: hypothetical protein ABEH81_00725 [Halopenitus sp.]